MATVQTLNTRLKLKYDTLENWNSVKDSFIPLKGEICFVEIPSSDTSVTTAPTVLFKVGDGTTAWGALKWGSALAADVYAWAKKSGIEIETTGTGSVISGIAWNPTNNKITVTKGNVDLSGYVPTGRKVAGKSLTADITLNPTDVGVNETAFPGLKKTGTVTAVKMNGVENSPESGVVDLGTVITEHQSVTLASGTNNGTLKLTVNGAATDNIAVKGLGSAAYKADTAFDTSGAAAAVLGTSSDTSDKATVYGAKAAAAAAQTTANGKYSKPSAGIPKTDLVAAVQTSLGKADTAVQKIETGSSNGTISVDGTDVAVKGLAALAYKGSLGKSDVGLGNVENKTLDTAVTASSGNYITSGAVKTYVDNAISGVTQFKYEIVSELPTAAKATMGKIYLVSHTHTTDDGYDEFITIESGSTTKTYSWEKIGNTDIDLDQYVKTLSGTANSGVITNLTKSGNTLTVTSTNLAVTKATSETGTALTFVDTLSQTANGKISYTKKTVTDVTQSAHGLMTAADKTKLDGIAAGATANKGTVTGITMNSNAVTVGTDGIVNLGTVITAHQSLAGKQDKLTPAQLSAVNSGITSTKVSTYDSYDSKISALEGKSGLNKVGTVTSVSAGKGLKVTGTASVTPKVEIDTAVTFVFDCGSSSTLTDNTGIA